MPKILRQKLPRALIQHLALRIRQREFTEEQIGVFGDWCDTNPEVPAGDWFKRFAGMTVCGQGELVKTFLLPDQMPHGDEVI